VGVAYSGVNRSRAQVFEHVRRLGYETPRYVCSKATTWPDLEVGDGSFILENNVVQPFVRIGSDTVLWSGNHIGHDSTLGDHVFVASHVVISGNCRVGDHTFLGVNATVRDGITIGRGCVIGAGAVILNDAPDGTVYRARATEPLPIESRALRRI
jgi:sugar O-acyltransferase (sialic acid O-acetyltransferase NeuD family)